MLHIKLKEMKCRTPSKQIFIPFTHIALRVRSGGQNNFFSESGHDAYQIKGNEVYNNTQAKKV